MGFTLEAYDLDPEGVALELLTQVHAVDARITVLFVQPKIARWLFHLSASEDINYGKGYQWM